MFIVCLIINREHGNVYEHWLQAFSANKQVFSVPRMQTDPYLKEEIQKKESEGVESQREENPVTGYRGSYLKHSFPI